MSRYFSRPSSEQREVWRCLDEHFMRHKVIAFLKSEKIPFLQEFRVTDWENFGYISIDLVLFSNSGEPLIALELKNTVDRSENIRGLGQCLIYRDFDFPSVALVTPLHWMSYIRKAAESGGINYVSSWNVEAFIKAEFSALGGQKRQENQGTIMCRSPKKVSFDQYQKNLMDDILVHECQKTVA